MANDETDALDALEKEAKEYDKVCVCLVVLPPLTDLGRRTPRLIES